MVFFFSVEHVLLECVNSMSLSLCLCLHTEFSLCVCHNVYHHKWVDAQFFMADAVFCCGTALTQKLCILLLLDYFHPRNHVLCHVYPLLSMCNFCLPLTEHVQTLYWACAEIIYIIYPVFDSFD